MFAAPTRPEKRLTQICLLYFRTFCLLAFSFRGFLLTCDSDHARQTRCHLRAVINKEVLKELQFPLLETTNWLKFQMPSTYWIGGPGVQGHVIQDICDEGGQMGHFTWKACLASKSADLASLPWVRNVLAADVCGKPAGMYDAHATSKGCRTFGCQTMCRQEKPLDNRRRYCRRRWTHSDGRTCDFAACGVSQRRDVCAVTGCSTAARSTACLSLH